MANRKKPQSLSQVSETAWILHKRQLLKYCLLSSLIEDTLLSMGRIIFSLLIN